MRSSIPNIMRAVNSATWAILPEKMDAIVEFLELRASGVAFSDDELAARGISAGPSKRAPTVNGQVAVLPLFGCIGQHMGMEMQISGGTSTEAFGRAFDDAMKNPDVSAIVIDCDSPGGSVSGVPELAAKIFKARGKGKRIVALSNSSMNSAAYWICSAAEEVWAAPSADVGSIGVFTMHTDTSEAEQKAGIKRTVIAAGKYKGEAAPGVPLTDDALAALQARVSECYAMFAGDVAKHRGVAVAAVKGGFGEGRSISAKQALAAGMIDKIGTMEDLLGAVSGRSASSGSRRMAAQSSSSIRSGPLADLSGVFSAPASMVAAEVPDPAYAVGARIVALVDHMPGMKGMAGAVNEARAGNPPYYAVDFDEPMGDGNPHKWLDETEVEPEDDDSAETVPTDSEGPEARGRARDGEPPIPATTRPAPQARSSTMSDQDTAAERAALETAARKAEATRVTEIFGLSAEHNIANDQRDQWVASGASVDAVCRELVAIGRDRTNAAPIVRVGNDRGIEKPWESLGAFAVAVMEAGTPGATRMDARLHAAATGVNQSIPSEGGFLVPPQFSTKVWDEQAGDADDLLSLTDGYAIDGESLTMNANAETSRANGSRFGGVRGYWINEADQITHSKPKFRQLRLEPQELAVLIYATDKSLRNSPVALGSYLERAAREEIKFMSGDAIINGTGAGQPLGILGADCVVSVAKETSQPAATIKQENISKMWARLHPRARAGAVWLMNVDCEPQLDFLNSVVTNVAGTENVGGYANKVYDAEKRTIKGRQIITTEFNATLGTVGDIVLANLGWYATGTRSSGARSDTSIHLRFDYAETAFRFMYELDGQPWLQSALTPYKGSATLTSFVTLATRA